MDSSLKQRLLGAVVLIALAIIFVPMFLSGSRPRPESETVNLKIPPAPDQEFQSRVLPVDKGTASGNGQAIPMPPPVAPAPVDAGKSTSGASVTVVHPATPVPTANAKGKSAGAAEDKPAEAPPGRAADTQFYVHLGVYAGAGNARDLVAAIKSKGFPAFTEDTSYRGKSAERVRVGPYGDRAAAEAARLRIQTFKPSVPGSVVELVADAQVDAPKAALPANRPGGWAVQLGAFGTAEDANKLRDRLRNTGFAAFVDHVTSNGKTLWRVRAGPELARADADKLRARIKDKLKINGIIVVQR